MRNQAPWPIRRVFLTVGLSLLSLWIMLVLLSRLGSAAAGEGIQAASCTNLIPNPGFDESGPADWVPMIIWKPKSTGSTPRLDRVEDTYRSSPASARIWHPGQFAMSAWESKSVLVEAGTSYVLQGYIQTQHLKGRAYIEVTFLDVQNEPIGQCSTPAVSDKSDWVAVTITTRSPSSAVRARVRCRVDGAGIAWFDNISLCKQSASVRHLCIEKATDRVRVEPREEVPFTLTWSNVGNSSVSTVTITDQSAYFDFLHTNPPAQEQDGASVWTFSGPVQPGAMGLITIHARLTDTVPSDLWTITNCVQIVSPETPVTSTCVTMEVSRTIRYGVGISPTESYREVSGPDLPQMVTFTHIVSNTGTMPEGILFELANPGITWATFTPAFPYTIPCCINPGEWRLVPITVEVREAPSHNEGEIGLQAMPATAFGEQAGAVARIRVRWTNAFLPFVTRRWYTDHLCNGTFSNGFACWFRSHTGNQPEPDLYWSIYGNAPPSAVLGSYKLGDTGSNETVPVGCSTLYQENVHVPNTPSPALTFKWQMTTYDIFCDEVARAIDSLEVYINSTPVITEGNPCRWTSGRLHLMDWCDAITPDGWRNERVSLASWRNQDVRVTFTLCNRDYPGTPKRDYDLYNSWAFIDDVDILEEGGPTSRCWQWSQCQLGKCTP